MTSTSAPVSATSQSPTISPSRPSWLSRHWFFAFGALFGLWVWTPFLAPILMHAGWSTAGRGLYLLYSFFCHQLPERSLFVFGPKPMYSLSELQAAGANTVSMLALRRFVGSPAMGWKIAWSDRMISFYTSIWAFAMLWHAFWRRSRPLSWLAFVLLLLPMVLDGGSHMVSDLSGIGLGFRDTNAWLAVLTSRAFPGGFYAGDAIGSFNSLMRLITGLLAGFGIAWFAFPHTEASFAEG